MSQIPRQITEHAFRYNKWANLHLLDVCAGLTPDQVQLTSPGTYGSIAATWQHLLSAEQRYLKRLGGSQPTLAETDAFPGIAELRRHADRSGDDLIRLGPNVSPEGTTEVSGDDGRYRLSLWVIAVQAIHHGNDHRTHICTILGHHGIEYGEMDVWAYGDAIGDTTLIEAKS